MSDSGDEEPLSWKWIIIVSVAIVIILAAVAITLTEKHRQQIDKLRSHIAPDGSNLMIEPQKP